MHDSVLDAALRDLSDAYDDFSNAPYQNAASVLQRFVVAFRAEPLAGFLRAALPPVDFPAWLSSVHRTRGSMVGSGKAHFAADRAERVAMQVALVEHVAGSEKHLLSFAHDFCNAGQNSISAHYRSFATTVLHPLLRDLDRLAENRIVPPVLFDVMGSLPPSGDAVLDQLLVDAVSKFKDVAPAVRKEGLERLWDAWERLKSMEDSSNKRLSVTALLDRAAPGGPFRGVLDDEAQRLTRVGNEFLIRHFETGKIAFERDSHVDYLFHRLFALIHLLLYARVL